MKKFVCTLLSLAVCVSLSVSVNAVSTNASLQGQANANSAGNLPSIVTQYTQAWVNVVDPADGLTASDPIPMVNAHNALTGYCLSFTQNGNPHGYAVVDLVAESVSEFSLDAGAVNIYDTLSANASKHGHHVDNRNGQKIRALSLDDFYIPTVDNGDDTLTDASGNAVDNTDFTQLENNAITDNTDASDGANMYSASSMPSDCGDVFKNNWSACASGCTSTKTVDISLATNWRPINEISTENVVGRYACAVTAMAEICDMYYVHGYTDLFPSNPVQNASTGDVNSSMTSAYLSLWNLSSTTSSSSSGSIILGGTSNANIGYAIVTYAHSKGYNNSGDCTFSGQTYSNFTSALDGGYPCIVCFRNASGSEEHAIVAYGYLNVAFGSTLNDYLHVANGWWGGSGGNSNNGSTVYYDYSTYSPAITYALRVSIS